VTAYWEENAFEVVIDGPMNEGFLKTWNISSQRGEKEARKRFIG
jgi:hypothetical protein